MSLVPAEAGQRGAVCLRPIADIKLVVQRMGMNEPGPHRDQRDFLQRHATAVGIVLVLGYSLFVGGLVGLLAAAVVLLVLAFVLGLIVTCIQSFRPFDPTSSLSTSGSRITSPMPFHRRLWRNFLIGLTDLPYFWPG
jgi:hypothetical protein